MIVVITEDPVTTKVGSGENGGKTLTEHFAARRLEVKAVRLDRSKPTTLAIPLAIEAGWDASRCLVAVYAQDETTGRMLQAATRRWTVAKGGEPVRTGAP